ncbi:hypothetical protein JMG10_02725 [Nostoc ellipsosporum NOK]|jgi:hypothetical protein|nr:hypothetical protein [Nostoc ellipsosporum NOK]
MEPEDRNAIRDFHKVANEIFQSKYESFRYSISQAGRNGHEQVFHVERSRYIEMMLREIEYHGNLILARCSHSPSKNDILIILIDLTEFFHDEFLRKTNEG